MSSDSKCRLQKEIDRISWDIKVMRIFRMSDEELHKLNKKWYEDYEEMERKTI